MKVAASPLFYWAMPESGIQLTSHFHDTGSPLEKGRAKGAGWICPAGASFYAADNALLAGIVFLVSFLSRYGDPSSAFGAPPL